MARTTAESLRAFGWRMLMVILNFMMLVFLIVGVMIQGEQQGTQALMWSLSVVVWVGGLIVKTLADNLDAPAPGESVQIVEGSHLWLRARAGLSTLSAIFSLTRKVTPGT